MRKRCHKLFRLQFTLSTLFFLALLISFLITNPVIAKENDAAIRYLLLKNPYAGFTPGNCNPNWDYLISQANSDSKVVIFPPPENTTTFIKCNTATDSDSVVRVGSYRTTVWRSDSFEGNFCQETSPDAKSLITKIQSTGGFDTGPGVYAGVWVDDIHPDVTMNATLQHNLPTEMVGNTGLWKAGPKISTHPCISPAECPDIWESGWRENYIVETSSKTPEDWHRSFSYADSPAKPQYLGETYQDGGVYKHYYRLHPTHQKWGQYWAIRQTFRSSGEVHIKPIFEKWRQHGLQNHYLGWPKYNIELHRPLEGGWCAIIKMLKFDAPEDWKAPAGSPSQ